MTDSAPVFFRFSTLRRMAWLRWLAQYATPNAATVPLVTGARAGERSQAPTEPGLQAEPRLQRRVARIGPHPRKLTIVPQ